jgi:hypothetical protein
MKKQQDVCQPGKVVAGEELYEAVWSKPLKVLAQEWDTTHDQLLLACKRMQVPGPNQRYWPLISWGHRVGRKPLPRRNRKRPGELLLPPRGRSRSALVVETSVTEEELRREAETRGLEERRRIEEQRRKVLVGSSEAWFKARRLRRFVRACEVAGRARTSSFRQRGVRRGAEHCVKAEPVADQRT